MDKEERGLFIIWAVIFLVLPAILVILMCCDDKPTTRWINEVVYKTNSVVSKCNTTKKQIVFGKGRYASNFDIWTATCKDGRKFTCTYERRAETQCAEQ